MILLLPENRRGIELRRRMCFGAQRAAGLRIQANGRSTLDRASDALGKAALQQEENDNRWQCA
jgi:hypothetical protein